MKHLAPLAFFALAFAPATALAQAHPVAPSPASVAQDELHFRFGFAAGWTLGAANNTHPAVAAVAFNPGAQLDLGAQINHHFALYVRAEAGTLVFLNQAAGYVVAEWSPLSWLSLGTGLGYDAMAAFSLEPCAGNCAQTAWSGVSVPLIFGFNFGAWNHWSEPGIHPAFRLGLEGAAGLEPSTATIGWHTSFTAGVMLW